MDYRYGDLPEACRCGSCGYVLKNPGTHCRQLPCPVCGGTMWRVKGNPGVAVGDYTEIVDIEAPDSAAAGERVDVTVKIENIDTENHLIACVAEVDTLRFIDEVQIIEAGKTNSYNGAFLMGGGDVTIHAYSYYPSGAEWIPDDRAEKDVLLKALPEPSFRGFGIEEYQTV